MDKVCHKCKKIIQGTLIDGYCDACHAVEMADFAAVKTYVLTHKHCSILEVIEQTGVAYRVIERLINQGGVSIGEDETKR